MNAHLRIALVSLMLVAGLLLAGPEPGVTFRTRVDLVMVPVVVRDSKGRAVATLTKENFRLFDNGEERPILQFAVERFAGVRRRVATAAAEAPGTPVAPVPVAAPEHFAAYLFDDLHATFGDMVAARRAAVQHLRGLAPATRAGIYTTSGRNPLEFTADQALLAKALDGLRTTLSPASAGIGCPSISYYEAYMIINWKRQDVIRTLKEEAIACNLGDPAFALPLVEMRSRQVLEEGQYQVRVSLIRLREVIRRLAVMPGKRVLVMVSPGFLSVTVETEINTLIDEALRAGIVINTLDVRGLYTEVPGGDAGRETPRGSVEVIQKKSEYEHQFTSLRSEVMSQLARATGGTFFHNSNDLEAGFDQLAAPPEAYYMLGFTPGEANGRYHKLRVKLTDAGKGLSVQARPGYFARKPGEAADSRSKEDLKDALLSRQELDDVPVTLETGLELLNLMVTARIDYARLEALSGGRPAKLDVVSAVFDRNGKLVRAVQKTLDLSGAAPAEESLRKTGLLVRTEFRVGSGPHTVRLLVRTPQGELLAAHSKAVTVP